MKKFAAILLCALIAAAPLSGCGGQVMLYTGTLLGRQLRLTVYGKAPRDILGRAADICGEYDGYFDPGSEDSVLNRLAAADGEFVEVPAEFMRVMRLAFFYYEISGGLYDVTAGCLQELWDFGSAQPRLPEEKDISEALGRVGMENVSLGACSVRVSEGTELLLDDIAAGRALDRLAELLRGAGVRGRIEYRGTVVFAGDPGKEARLAFPGPDGTDELYSLRAPDKAVSFETVDGKSFSLGAELYDAFLDPETGMPSDSDLISAAVAADSAVQSIMLAKLSMLMGLYDAMDLIRGFTGAGGAAVTGDCRLHVTSGFASEYDMRSAVEYTEHFS